MLPKTIQGTPDFSSRLPHFSTSARATSTSATRVRRMSSRVRTSRRRHTQACIPCQSSKRRCSSGLPCSHCIRRNCESACVYNRDRRKRHPGPLSLPISEGGSGPAPGSETLPLQEHLQTPPQPQTWPGPQSSFPTPSTPDEVVGSAQPVPDSNAPGETPEDHAFLQPRILKDSSGNDGIDRHTDPRRLGREYVKPLTCLFSSIRRKLGHNCILAARARYYPKPDGTFAVY